MSTNPFFPTNESPSWLVAEGGAVGGSCLVYSPLGTADLLCHNSLIDSPCLKSNIVFH